MPLVQAAPNRRTPPVPQGEEHTVSAGCQSGSTGRDKEMSITQAWCTSHLNAAYSCAESERRRTGGSAAVWQQCTAAHLIELKVLCEQQHLPRAHSDAPSDGPG